MKKIIKSFIGIIIILSIVMSFFSFTTSAAGSVISFSKKSLTVGESLTVSVTVDAGEAMYGVSCIVNYDSNVLEYKSGSGTGGAGTLKIIESPSGETKVTYSLTFAAKTAGSCAISVADCVYSTLGENGSTDKGLSGASAAVTVNNAALSSNANLQSLTLSKGSLSPAFSASKTSYKVNVGNDVTECSIYATAADGDAKVEISGKSALSIGANTRTVTVTAPNGTQKVYTVTINRSATADEAETSSEEETTEEEEEKPLETNVDGVDYTIVSDLSDIKLFKGFDAIEIDYNETKIYVAQDINNHYSIYYLKSADSKKAVPYTYDKDENVFTKLAYAEQGDNTYIFADVPGDFTVPADYYTTNVEISSFNIRCYADSRAGMSDFYYVYCYVDDEYGFYRYDSKENILQRYPELTLVPITNLETNEPEVDPNAGFVARFQSLSRNAKLIFVGIILLICLAIALIVLLIIKFVNRKNDYSYDEDYLNSLDFDDITLNDSSLIIDDEDEISINTEIIDDGETQEPQKTKTK